MLAEVFTCKNQLRYIWERPLQSYIAVCLTIFSSPRVLIAFDRIFLSFVYFGHSDAEQGHLLRHFIICPKFTKNYSEGNLAKAVLKHVKKIRGVGFSDIFPESLYRARTCSGKNFHLNEFPYNFILFQHSSYLSFSFHNQMIRHGNALLKIGWSRR